MKKACALTLCIGLVACGDGKKSAEDKPAAPTTKPSEPAKPTEEKPKPKPERMVKSITPGAVIGMAERKALTFKKGEKEHGFDGANGTPIYFVKRPFKTKAGDHVLVLWAEEEGTEINGALLSGKPGQWAVHWTATPMIEDGGTVYTPESLEMTTFVIEGDRIGALYSQETEGCGSDDCTPEDDYVESSVYELGAKGPKSVWSIKGPACRSSEGVDTATKSKPHTCWVALLTKNDGPTELHALIHNAKGESRIEKYEFIQERYQLTDR